MTDAELAVLSLVAEEPRHGYEIERVIEERGVREWTEVGFSSIYYLLKKLEREAMIEGRLEEASRGPARKVYHVTETGRRAWHKALLRTLSMPQLKGSALMVGLSNLSSLEPDEVLAALRAYHRALGERLGHVEEAWADQHPAPFHVEALFDYGVTMLKAEREWVNGFIDQLLDRRQGYQDGQG
jgi:DNA-binding PadR family transcriptional regulator